jgi:conserved oligomeric Golgi complex subunit 3
MAEIGRQVAATQSESARYALAYGRFEEMILESYALIPNVQKVVRRAYDQYGRPVEGPRDMSTYANSADSIFQTYLTTRDRELKVMTQHDVAEYQKEVKTLSAETASRNYIKQCFERAYNEDSVFTRLFNLEPTWSNSPDSVFQAIKAVNTSMVHPGHLTPLGNALKSQLQSAGLKATCNVTGWLANEYSVAEIDDEESPFFRKCREYAARLLVDHLWPFADGLFEAEITKAISKAPVQDSALKMVPVEGGIASSNAYHLVKQAIELLAMFDQAMPKERSVRFEHLRSLVLNTNEA